MTRQVSDGMAKGAAASPIAVAAIAQGAQPAMTHPVSGERGPSSPVRASAQTGGDRDRRIDDLGAVDQDSRAVLAHHGRSFNWAGRFLSPAKLDRAARLYAFCRYLDDLADEEHDIVRASHNLRQVQADLTAGTSHRPDVADFFDLCDGAPSAIAGARMLADMLVADLEPMRLARAAELKDYALGVAGCVGVMMCPVLEVREQERALPFAIDLGLAMQMTNIARDVLEDAGRTRVYLPAEWTDGPLEPEALVAGTGDDRARAWTGVLHLLEEADRYYDSARTGLCFLPLQARAAIHVASRVYRGIGGVIRRGGPARYWQGRAFTTRSRKIILTAGALAGLTVLPGRLAARHDTALHDEIEPMLRRYDFIPTPDGLAFRAAEGDAP